MTCCIWHIAFDFASLSIQVKDPKNPTKQKEDRELINFTGPADSVYLKARDYVELDVGTGEFQVACCSCVCLESAHYCCCVISQVQQCQSVAVAGKM